MQPDSKIGLSNVNHVLHAVSIIALESPFNKVLYSWNIIRGLGCFGLVGQFRVHLISCTIALFHLINYNSLLAQMYILCTYCTKVKVFWEAPKKLKLSSTWIWWNVIAINIKFVWPCQKTWTWIKIAHCRTYVQNFVAQWRKNVDF